MSDTVAMPATRFANSSDLAHALRDYAKPEFGKGISLVPYNRFLPQDTSWWICPGSEDPAYHYGKFLVKTIDANQLFAGICFEKGIGRSAAEFFRSRASWIVQRTWIWNSFLAALAVGEFDRFVKKAQEVSGRPVDVIVSASMMSPPDSGKREESAHDALDNLPRQKINYRVDNSKLSLFAEDSNAAKLISAPGDCQTLTELATKIQNVKQADWVWINVEFGSLLTLEGTQNPWPTETIWANTCEPYLEWFR